MFLVNQSFKCCLVLQSMQGLKIGARVTRGFAPKRALPSGRFLKNISNKYSSQPSSKAWPKWPLCLATIVSVGFFSYHYFLPNISGFPQESRKHIRNALWARDKLCDIPEAIIHFKKAIEHMSQNSPETEAWHLVGTISELNELLISENRVSEAITYYNEAINILFLNGFDSPEKTKKQSNFLPFKTRNKLVSIKLELAQLYHKLDDLSNEKKSLDDALVLIFNEAFTAYGGEDILENRQQKIKLPRWLSNEDVYSALGQAADFYQTFDNPRYAIPLYHTAIYFCKVATKRAVLLCNLGSSYHLIGEYNQAIHFFQEGFAILKDNLSSQDESSIAKATILLNLAMTYEAKTDYEKSQEVFEHLWSMKKHVSSRFPSEKWSLVKSRLLSQG